MLFRYCVLKDRIITGKRLFLVFVDTSENGFRRAFFRLMRFVFKGSPAEKATLVAAQRWRKLDAAMARDPIKLVLVTHVPALEGAFAPHTGLQSG